MVVEIVRRAETLSLPDWYLAAGCLYQTVWNVLDGRDPQYGIDDYDLIYFNAEDLSWEAEDVVIRRCAEMFGDLGVEVEVRNQARVHLWYEHHFGVPCPPPRRSTAMPLTPAAWVCAEPAVATRSTRHRGSTTCSASSFGPTRCSPLSTSTRRRPPGGSGSGPA